MFKIGVHAIINDSGNEYGHCFIAGQVVTVVGIGNVFSESDVVIKGESPHGNGNEIEQIVLSSELDMV